MVTSHTGSGNMVVSCMRNASAIRSATHGDLLVPSRDARISLFNIRILSVSVQKLKINIRILSVSV